MVSNDSLRRKIFPGRLVAILALALALGLLAACSSSSSKSPATSTGAGATPGATASSSATSAAQATATATLGAGMFHATISEQFSANTCSASSGEPTDALCLTATGTGQAQPIGNFTFTRSGVLERGGANSCGPSTMKGSIQTSPSDAITFSATGTFCRGTLTATYTYTVTGGTGKYHGASGKGTIQIPRPTTSTMDTETWNGTLTYQG